jgi:Domain of unknown function (DUF4276)
MRGLYIIVEGPTEEEFVNNSLRNYFIAREIYDVRAIKMETSPGFKGGDVKYFRYKSNVVNLLKDQSDILVTSLIDFFRLEKDFPNYEKAIEIVEKTKRVDFLENEVLLDINDYRFIPYIQLHEFEGLLFSAKTGFSLITHIPTANFKILEKIVDDYPNPELINDGATTAPSKRLIRLIQGYQKTFHGPLIALENGIDSIIATCPRFRNWIDILVTRMKA